MKHSLSTEAEVLRSLDREAVRTSSPIGRQLRCVRQRLETTRGARSSASAERGQCL